MTLTHGADAARLRQIAAQLRGQAKLTSRIGAEGGARTSVISGVWEGPDREDFVRDWRVAERSLDPVLGKSFVVYLRKPEHR